MVTASDGLVRIAACDDADPAAAAAALVAALGTADLSGIMVFASRIDALRAFAAAVRDSGWRGPLTGCTTAGEITPWGRSGSIAAVGFPAADFHLEVRRFDGLLGFDPVAAHRAVAEAVAEGTPSLERLGGDAHRAAVLLIDGLSCREELVTHTMRHLLGDISMVGGSAGDEMRFGATHLLHDDVLRSDSALLAILWSRHPLRLFRAECHEAGDVLAVITRVDPAARIAFELNGEPAADEYARLVGVAPDRLGPEVFAAHPFMVRVGGRYYARAPMRVLADRGLVFHSAIERGLALRLGHSTGLMPTLRRSLDQWSGLAVDAVLAFDSVHNRIEAESTGCSAELDAIYRRYNCIGFHGYGEQYRDLHLNRNFAGLAICRPRA